MRFRIDAFLGAVFGRSSVTSAPSAQLLQETKARNRHFYTTVNQQLDATVFGPFSYFLNYGYAPNGGPTHAVVELPPRYTNTNSARLVLELVGDCPVVGCRVLDVGCGRGGTIHVLKTMFQPRSLTGLDLCPAAVAFCRRTHGSATTRFVEGDAESLPFDAGAFDVVTNVESSHSYPCVHAFYAEVHRVLQPGGCFLYADCHTSTYFQESERQLKALGFSVERETDITANVLRSCDEIASRRLSVFQAGPGADQQVMQNFLATPESDFHAQMRSRAWVYRIYRFRKH